jgi:hypothetical protein
MNDEYKQVVINIFRLKKTFKFPSFSSDKSYDGWNMVITPFQNKKFIEAYNQQLTIRTRVSIGKNKDLVPKDLVTISEESRRRIAADRSFPEPVKSMTNNRGPSTKGGV